MNIFFEFEESFLLSLFSSEEARGKSHPVAVMQIYEFRTSDIRSSIARRVYSEQNTGTYIYVS